MLTKLFPANWIFISRMFSGCQCHLVHSKHMLLAAFLTSKWWIREQRGKHPSFKFCFGHWRSSRIFSWTTWGPDFSSSKPDFWKYLHSASKGWSLEIWTTITDHLTLWSGTGRYKIVLWGTQPMKDLLGKGPAEETPASATQDFTSFWIVCTSAQKKHWVKSGPKRWSSKLICQKQWSVIRWSLC